MFRVLVVTAEPDVPDVIRSAYPDGEIKVVRSIAKDDHSKGGYAFDYAFIDVSALRPLGGVNDQGDFLRTLRRFLPAARVVVMSRQSETREAVGYVRQGVGEYLTYPIVREEVQLVRESIDRKDHLRSELRYFRDRSLEDETLGPITSRADSMKAVFRKIRQVAPTRSTVLLTGETGTGKSFLAKVIHQHSSREQRQFVAIHCGAIPDTLLESELFGHERGAFTGADRRKPGKFEIANGGTLFLDEIATITPAMQVKLLNVLQERTIQRVGGDRDVEVDVRILAASNMDLEDLTQDGGFRKDLYYRLNVFPIEVPPLRQRREDIPSFVEMFLDRLRPFHKKEIDGVHPAVMEALLNYEWPGNVRELENLMERAYILESSSTMGPESFPEELFGKRAIGRIPVDIDSSLASVRQRAAEHAERVYLQEQLVFSHGRIDATAEAAGISTRQLHKLMSKHGLKKDDFKTTGGQPGNPSSES